MTVATELDKIQSRLHDGGSLWARTELLRWYQDGYRELLALSAAKRRWRLMDLPGRHTYALTFEWEDRHTTGTVRKPSRTSAAGWAQGTTLWEVEHLAGVSTAAALDGFTHEWERLFLGDSDRHYRFSLPKNHERIARVSWNERALTPVSVRELDETDDRWQGRLGEPRWWTTGLGRVTSFEVYAIRQSDTQQYALGAYDAGLPRGFSGLRTYGIGAATAGNAYAYTTFGDRDTLTAARCEFEPASCYTQSWELAELPEEPGYNFTINFTMLARVTRTVVHPWEMESIGWPIGLLDAASPGKRGMFSWERLDPKKNYESQVFSPTLPPALTGPGAQITTPASTLSRGFGTQVWEAEWLDGDTTFTTGLARSSYSWEAAYGGAALTLGLGAVRAVSSTERQYLGVASDPSVATLLGASRDWRSSTDSLAVLEVIVPDGALNEAATPSLVASPMQKYLRFYVLSRCFGRAGEGHNTILADHYQRRFLRGVALLQRVGNVADRDRVYRRDEVATSPARRLPRVGLPAEFPAIW